MGAANRGAGLPVGLTEHASTRGSIAETVAGTARIVTAFETADDDGNAPGAFRVKLRYYSKVCNVTNQIR